MGAQHGIGLFQRFTALRTARTPMLFESGFLKQSRQRVLTRQPVRGPCRRRRRERLRTERGSSAAAGTWDT